MQLNSHENLSPNPYVTLKASDPETWEHLQSVLADDFIDQQYFRSKYREAASKKSKARHKYKGHLY